MGTLTPLEGGRLLAAYITARPESSEPEEFARAITAAITDGMSRCPPGWTPLRIKAKRSLERGRRFHVTLIFCEKLQRV